MSEVTGLNAALGDWALKGYTIKDGGYIVTVCFGDEELAAYPQGAATPVKVQDTCSRHHNRTITQQEVL